MGINQSTNQAQQSDLRRLKLAVKDTQPLLVPIRNERIRAFNRRFYNEIDFNDNPTKRLSRNYRRWKESAYPGRKIRQLTGRLKASYSCRIIGKDVIEDISDPKAEIVFKTRPLLPGSNQAISETDLREIENIAETWLDNLLK